jgi:hypothetical protein
MSVERIRPERCPYEGDHKERERGPAPVDVAPEPLGLSLTRYRASRSAVSAAGAEGPKEIVGRHGGDEQNQNVQTFHGVFRITIGDSPPFAIPPFGAPFAG